jgi:hypothetical protein
MELGLGHFGDLRLEKGGSFFWVGWSRRAVVRFGSGGSAAIERARSGSRASCVIDL